MKKLFIITFTILLFVLFFSNNVSQDARTVVFKVNNQPHARSVGPVSPEFNKVYARFSDNVKKRSLLWFNDEAVALYSDLLLPLVYCENKKLTLCMTSPLTIFIPKENLSNFVVETNSKNYKVEIEPTNCLSKQLKVTVINSRNSSAERFVFDEDGLYSVTYTNVDNTIEEELVRQSGKFLDSFVLFKC